MAGWFHSVKPRPGAHTPTQWLKCRTITGGGGGTVNIKNQGLGGGCQHQVVPTPNAQIFLWDSTPLRLPRF